MNPTVERILEEKLFQKNILACDTIDKQVKFCEEFLRKYGPSNTFAVNKNVGKDLYQTRWGNIEWLTTQYSFAEYELQMPTPEIQDMVSRQLLSAMMDEITKINVMKITSHKDMLTRSEVFRAQLGVLIPNDQV